MATPCPCRGGDEETAGWGSSGDSIHILLASSRARNIPTRASRMSVRRGCTRWHERAPDSFDGKRSITSTDRHRSNYAWNRRAEAPELLILAGSPFPVPVERRRGGRTTGVWWRRGAKMSRPAPFGVNGWSGNRHRSGRTGICPPTRVSGSGGENQGKYSVSLGVCPRIRVRNPQVLASKQLASFEPN